MRETKLKKKFKSNQAGITLIALVITIIVLIILAGVAINMLSGDNRYFKTSSRGKRTNRGAINIRASKTCSNNINDEYRA